MAAWYEPAGGASRATCVAQIVTDINSYVTTSTDGLTTFDIDGFMALAATRLAAIPDPTATGEYYVMAGVLRSTNVRPDVEVLLGSLESVQVNNAGYDLQPHIVGVGPLAHLASGPHGADPIEELVEPDFLRQAVVVGEDAHHVGDAGVRNAFVSGL